MDPMMLGICLKPQTSNKGSQVKDLHHGVVPPGELRRARQDTGSSGPRCTGNLMRPRDRARID